MRVAQSSRAVAWRRLRSAGPSPSRSVRRYGARHLDTTQDAGDTEEPRQARLNLQSSVVKTFMTNRPIVIVTRQIPAAVEQEIDSQFDARLNPDDRPMSADALKDAMR